MEIRLAENIRRSRKERSLTQEQFAEIFGVTTGAVYKWEAGLSVPDIGLIVQMADFFDTSVDVLLGYEMKDNRPEETVRRLRDCRRRKDRAGLAEAEKALKKYPYSFEIVRECAAIYRAFGFESGDRELLRRALGLLEQARPLLGQNTDPEISEQTLYGKIAETYLGLDEADKAVALWKTHNAGGLFNHRIGQVLAISDRTEEAVPFLSEATAQTVSELCNIVIGYLNVFYSRGDYASARAILEWGIGVFAGLRKGNAPNFLDKISCGWLASLACLSYLSGEESEARDTLVRAKALAAFFDASPSYDESDIRYINRIEGASAHDDIGATAADAIQNVVNSFENDTFTALWRAVSQQEESHD